MPNSKDNSEPEVLISKHQFYFETPLYDQISRARLDKNFLEGDVNGYNPFQRYDTTFHIMKNSLEYNSPWWTGCVAVQLTCKRNEKDNVKFLIFKNDDIAVKLGQFPSLADIQFADIGRKYDKVLDENSLFEFKRAIGLAAHGTGVGSFVYLRRIFEKLIFQTFENNKDNMGIKVEEFDGKRMEEKVLILKPYLPSQLVEMRSIYGILSRGVHELDEQECLTYFDPLKLSIELILDQKIEMDAKKERDQQVKEQIQSINKTLAGMG